MATIDSLTVDITPVMKSRTGKHEVSTMKPIGKEKVAECIRNIGQYIIDNAEKIAENIDFTVEINIHANISLREFPTVEIVYTNQIPDTSMLEKTEDKE